MSFPYKKLSSGWDYISNYKTNRKKLKRHTENVINQEIYGEETDKRFGKRKKKNISKPYKIFVRYKENRSGYWFYSKVWRLEKEFEHKNDRDHELSKMKRGYMEGWYDFMAVDSDEEAEELLKKAS